MEKNRGAASLQKRPWLTVKDLGEILVLICCTPLAWILPPKLWKTFSLPAAQFSNRLRINNTKEKIVNIRGICGDHIDELKPETIESVRAANVLEQKIQYLREYRPGGWEPVISVRGIESVENALETGRGAILWIAPFFFNNLVVKKGLYQAGLPINHLSAYNHGPSLSRFGIRYVNAVYIKAENKYLKERIVIQPARDLIYKNAGTNLTYIRKLENKLKGNGLISISCQPDPALEHQGVAKKLLNGKLLLATGAPALALAYGSALIPVFTIRTAPDNFEIILESPLKIPDEGSRKDKVHRLLGDFSKLTEAYTVKYPELFKPWHELRVDGNIDPGDKV
jgi:lauroyl/myristoyl acyltransferase